MSKILRRCLSLALVLMLLASLSISGTLNASADNKTGEGLAAYAMTAYNEGWQYVWGGASYGAVDCSGLIYSYVGGGARVTEDMLYTSPESGYVSEGVPDIPGLGLWQPGHVGVYVGGGMAVDARDEISNVCYQSVSTKSWVMWFKVAGVSYGSEAGVTNDDRSENTAEESDTDTQIIEEAAEPEYEVLSYGSYGSDVNALQERLKELGYFADSTTEYFGSITLEALREFQADAGIPVTGRLDEMTKDALESGNAPTKQSEVIEQDEPEEEEEALEIEQDEDDIESEPDDALQTDLTQGGGQNADELDSEEESVPEEDEFDDEDDFAQSDEEEEDGEPSASAPFDEDEDEQSSASSSSEEESSQAAVNAVYKLGDEAAEISDIQYILIKLGYFDYNITGCYCENTADAVESFRADYGLEAGNYLDAAAIDALFKAYGEVSTLVYSGTTPLYEGVAAEEPVSDTEQDAEEAENDTDKSETSEESSEDSDRAVISAESTDANTSESAVPDSEQNSGSEAGSTGAAEASQDKSGDKPAPSVTSPKTGDGQNVVFIQTGIEDYFSKTLAIIVIAVSLIVIFFAGTIRYWNVSMEKRKQRARRATTVSVYRRGSM